MKAISDKIHRVEQEERRHSIDLKNTIQGLATGGTGEHTFDKKNQNIMGGGGGHTNN